jgi:hypothetical protein
MGTRNVEIQMRDVHNFSVSLDLNGYTAEAFRRFGDEWKFASERISIQPREPSRADCIRSEAFDFCKVESQAGLNSPPHMVSGAQAKAQRLPLSEL